MFTLLFLFWGKKIHNVKTEIAYLISGMTRKGAIIVNKDD